MSIVEFLLARIAEDEEVARAALDAPDSTWWVSSREQRIVRGDPATRAPIAEALSWRGAAHIARHDPARAMAECEAKRDLIEWALGIEHLRSVHDPQAPVHALGDDVLRILAQVYAEHSDYDEAWRP